MSVSKNEKLELAAGLLEVFRGREDRLAVENSVGFSPEELDHPLDADRLASEHLTGCRCLAFYVMRPDNTVTLSCLDLDSKPDRPDPAIRAKVEAVVEALREAGIRPLVELSQSGRGVHVWVFFDAPIEAWLVRAFWRGVVAHVDIPVPEIFPRQDQLKGKALGNAIRYPLFNRSQFVDTKNGWRKLRPSRALRAIRRVSSAGLATAADKLGFPLERPRPSPAIAEFKGDVSPSVSPRVQQLLADTDGTLAKRWAGDTTGMNDRSRSSLAAAIACQLVWLHIPTPEITEAVAVWCDRTGYEKGRRADWIAGVVQSAYEHVWKRDDERRLRQASQEAFQGLSADQRRLVRRAIARKQTVNN